MVLYSVILLIRHWHHLHNNNVLESFNQPESIMTQEDFDQTVKSGQYDTYPLTVEEYETLENIVEDVEVE